jgi:hypothetical protein
MILEEIQIPQKPAEFIGPMRPNIIDEHGVLRIDNSSLEHFTTCARSAEYYLLHRRELSATKSALSFGSFIHKALEELYIQYPDGAVTDTSKFINEVMAMSDEHFQQNPVDSEETFRTPQRAVDTIVSYLALSIAESFRIHTFEGKPQVEIYFELPLGEVEFGSVYNGKHYETIQVMWCGRIDAIIELDGGLWIMDHKTTSILGETFFADFANSNAPIGYTWAAQQLLQHRVEGLFLNAIAIRKASKTGTPFDIQRQRFPYDPERIEEWKYNTLVLVSDFLSHMDRQFFPMETKWCVGKYGKCPYFDVCTLPPAQRLPMLNSNFYRNVTWTPKNR